jgi:predicted O-methyltransferase YrrM
MYIKKDIEKFYKKYILYIYMSNLEKNIYNNHINEWKKYILNNLIPIIKSLNVKLEGNIYSSHLTFNENTEMEDKQSNIYKLLNDIKPKKVLEIGFNAGFSCLFMKMINPNLDMTCIDLNEHKYVMPCFNRIKQDYKYLRLIPESSYDTALPKLIELKETFDLIHIDGDHRIEGARKDLELCLKLCKNNTIIIFDDTNLSNLNKLCDEYVKKGLVIDYKLEGFKNSQHYKHRILQIRK